MIPETRLPRRIPSDQKPLITEVIEFRRRAMELRERVSNGSYEEEELQEFWYLTANAGMILAESNPELARLAGLGGNFFVTVARDKRRPKLPNFLKALAAIVEVANERLHDVDIENRTASVDPLITPQTLEISPSRIDIYKESSSLSEHGFELLGLAISLEQMARNEIVRLDNFFPNDPQTIEDKIRQRELMEIFADGFAQITSALEMLKSNPGQKNLLDRAGEIVNNVGSQVTDWCEKNGAELVDWSVRIPSFAAGVALLGWAGANMTVATSTIAAIVGGQKVVDAIGRRKRGI